MTKNYFAPHKIVAKIFRAPSKIVKYFSYPNHIRSARVPGIKNGRSLNLLPSVKFCFILEGVDLLDHTSIFLLRTINHRVIPIIRILS